MKKILLRVIIALFVLVALAAVAVVIFLDSGVKRGIETVGPMLTKVPVKLSSVNISILSGSGKISGLDVGNPEGYKTPSAIKVGTASLSLQPGSILKDKVVIHSINVQSPEITFETDLKGNNLSKIVSNLQESPGGAKGTQPPANKTEAKASKKLQVDDFVIKDAQLHVSLNVAALGAKSATVTMPEIRLTNLGQGPEGITAAELTKRVLQEIEKVAVQQAGSVVGDLSKQASELTKGAASALGGASTGAVDKATKSLGDLFKKK